MKMNFRTIMLIWGFGLGLWGLSLIGQSSDLKSKPVTAVPATVSKPAAAAPAAAFSNCDREVLPALREICQKVQERFAEEAPCTEMAMRGWQAEADRCLKEARELARDYRDRIRFQQGR